MERTLPCRTITCMDANTFLCTIFGPGKWLPVADNYLKTGSVGAIDVAQSDPNIVYVGMGEETLRGNVSHGDGVYKTTDGGKIFMRNMPEIPREHQAICFGVLAGCQICLDLFEREAMAASRRAS